MSTCIVWDWNGTLLDDVSVAMQARNHVFPDYGVPPLHDAEQYQNLFCFPVKKYYLDSGIREADYNEVAERWFEEYRRLFTNAALREHAQKILNHFKEKGYRQVVLSASRMDVLKEQITHFSVSSYFDDVLALDDIHARDKVFLAEEYFAGRSYDRIIVIGDTSHDYDVAKAIGAQMIFIADGHESLQKLEKQNQTIAKSLLELLRIV